MCLQKVVKFSNNIQKFHVSIWSMNAVKQPSLLFYSHETANA